MSDDAAVRRILRNIEREIAGAAEEVVVVLAADGSLLLRRSGTHDRVEFHDLPEAALRGAYLTHNHPRGTSFSVQDVRLLLVYRLAEIRAVSTRHRYTLALPEDQWEDADHLIAWVHQRLRDDGLAAINAGLVDATEHEVTFLHRLWLEIGEIRGWRHRQEDPDDRTEDG